MKRHTFFRAPQQSARLKKLVKKTGIKESEHERRAIDEYLDRHGV